MMLSEDDVQQDFMQLVSKASMQKYYLKKKPSTN